MICKTIFHNRIFTYFLAIALIIGDQLSKQLRETYTKNTGIAFSLFKNNLLFITITTGVFSLVILLFWILKVKNIYWNYGLALLFAGAISNEIDRIFRGFVIDFIDYKGLFIGNVADIYVCVAAVAIFILLLKNIKIR